MHEQHVAYVSVRSAGRAGRETLVMSEFWLTDQFREKRPMGVQEDTAYTSPSEHS